MKIDIYKFTGEFAENKDIARKIRLEKILPSLKNKKQITLDFTNVTGTTQSFMHALISDAIRKYEDDVYELVLFKDCSPVVKEVINIVFDYMQES